LGENERQFLFRFRQLQLADRIERQFFSFNQKPIECSKGRELKPDVRTRLAILHQREQVIAKIVRGTFLP